MLKGNSNTALVEGLKHFLADTYLLYVKTQNYHWNVTGENFSSLHALFQVQYEDMSAAVDEIAERIRALGEKSPGSLAAFSKLAKVKEENGSPAWKDMLRTLAHDQEIVVGTAQAALGLSQDTEDDATADLLIKRISQHQKNLWMLKAHLE